MTRMSKQSQRRAVSPRAPKLAGKKTGSKKDKYSGGFKPHENAVAGGQAVFIPKVK